MKAFAKQLSKQDDMLLNKIFDLMKERLKTNPYGWDGEFSKEISGFPKGFRAMAATHHLDVSLALDDLGWHFLNFGESSHVRETEAGLRELDLHELADLFAEAYRIMKPHLPEIRKPGGDYFACLQRSGEMKRINELTDRAWKLQKSDDIYSAWIRYARANPEAVFGS
jgi:hypothetical protein